MDGYKSLSICLYEPLQMKIIWQIICACMQKKVNRQIHHMNTNGMGPLVSEVIKFLDKG